MASSPASDHGDDGDQPTVCVNNILTDDELRLILAKLDVERDRENFGFVCKKWLQLQSSERKKLAARAGPHMLEKLASRFSCLIELDLSQSVSRSFYPGVMDSDLKVIASRFRRLKVLNLSHCKGITDVGMTQLGAGLSSLQFLDVSYCRKLSDKGVTAIAKGCPDLRRLHLAGCKSVTDITLRALSANCKNLEELCLEGCTNITDNGIANLVVGCQQIKVLDINKCSNVSDTGISIVAKACSSFLRTLKLSDCYKAGDESIFALATYCKNLETLFIGGCRGISNESMKSLAVACGKSLRNLRMDWCSNISDSSLNCILKHCECLEALDVTCCEEVTDAAFQGLDDGIQLGLRILKISNCPSMSVTGIGILLEKCSSLEYLDVRSCPHITKATCDEAELQFPERCRVNFTGSLHEPDLWLQ